LLTTHHRCNLDVWALMAQSRDDGHRSLVTPESVLSEYNKDLIFFLKFCILYNARIIIKKKHVI